MQLLNPHPNLPQEMLSEGIYKIVLSQPTKKPQQESVTQTEPHTYTRAEVQRSGDMFQLSKYTKKQVFHNNFTIDQLKTAIDGLFGTVFMQYHAWDAQYEYSAKVSKKGKVLSSRKKSTTQPRTANFASGSFDRQKNHIIKEGENIAPLQDMGIFTPSGKVSTGMGDKLSQINRFLELLADETGPTAIPENTTVNIIDFGCGKSYLTFLVYHYFTNMRKLDANICGLDLDASIVKTCTAAAQKYGYNQLSFIQGDIGNQAAPPLATWGQPGTCNIVISLHACNTATDYALYNALKWKADLIYAVPCCQHELKQQMKPANLTLFNRYGIIKERISALATDAIRANLLECCGYKTQIIEFVDTEHTPKNLLIRARRHSGKTSTTAWSEIESTVREFSYEPMLLKLALEGNLLVI